MTASYKIKKREIQIFIPTGGFLHINMRCIHPGLKKKFQADSNDFGFICAAVRPMA